MNYAKLGLRKFIQRIIVADSNTTEDVSDAIVLTDEQVELVKKIKSENTPPIWFDGRVTTWKLESVGHRFRWNPQLGDYTKTIEPQHLQTEE
jgi:hypothetical protein